MGPVEGLQLGAGGVVGRGDPQVRAREGLHRYVHQVPEEVVGQAAGVDGEPGPVVGERARGEGDPG